ncbi:MAG: prolyl oligopeptidase family serine peptidase [Bacteroidota bacterium]
MKNPLFLLGLLLYLGSLDAQNQRLEIEDLSRWNRIQSPSINADGTYAAYTLSPDYGDGRTEVVALGNSDRRFVLPQVVSPRFTYGGRYLLGLQKPTLDTTRAYKLKEEEKALKDMDSLLVLDTRNGKQEVIPQVYDWKTGKYWDDFYAYTTGSLLADSLQKGLADGAKRLVVRRFGSDDSLSLEGVTNFTLAERGAALIATRAAHDSLWSSEAVYLKAEEWRWQTIFTSDEDRLGTTGISEQGDHVAFITSPDSLKEDKQAPWSLYTWSGSNRAQEIDYQWMPYGYRISPDARLYYCKHANRLYFGITPRKPERDSTILDEDVANVEVWTTQDARLYPQQNILADRERKRSYACMLDLDRSRVRIIETPDANSMLVPENCDLPYVAVYDQSKYLRETSWAGFPTRSDVYLLDLDSGNRKQVATGISGTPLWSPAGKYLYWYSRPDTAWMAYSVADQQTRQLTDNSISAFYDEDNDRPMHPNSYGYMGWSESDVFMHLYDRYDIWRIDPSGKKAPERITDGRANNQRFRYIELDEDKKFFTEDDRVLIYHFDEDDYHAGYNWLYLSDGRMEPLQEGPYTYTRRVLKAREEEAYLYTFEDFETFPDLQFSSDLRLPADAKQAGKSKKRISSANPQQADFGWGTAETYEWIDPQGRRLRGMLIKPANFDPNERYPMIVNFYERSSEGVYRHRPPYAHRSTINYAYYANRGYLIFNPDVIYRVGYPGESAYDCVMSGLNKLMENPWLDRNRIGLQGHSWGGYQAAYLVTKTDLFACAESGAPVVNMFSAYGGIRWRTGLSRAFQYEHTQSRIGGTPWTHHLRYIENSPIFTTDKINTPLLIMHNDKDGAVPWYQGIEWFTALRRLDKPAWMLNYQGEPHWPLRHANRVDFQRRMSQFFDHYLQGARMPRWMHEGVDPLELGIEQGYELSRQ